LEESMSERKLSQADAKLAVSRAVTGGRDRRIVESDVS
jgi:hypothetical protein